MRDNSKLADRSGSHKNAVDFIPYLRTLFSYLASRALYCIGTVGLVVSVISVLHAADGAEKKDPNAPTWTKPKIYIYQPPPVEVSTVTTFRTVDPQIIQKLIDPNPGHKST